MIIQCDKCNTRFKVDDSKIPEKGARIKCKKCQHIFKIERPQVDLVEARTEDSVAPTPPSATEEKRDETRESLPPPEIEHGGFWGTETSAMEEKKEEIPEEESKEEVPEMEKPSLPEFEEDFGISREVEEKGFIEEEPTRDSFKDEFIAREEGAPQVARGEDTRRFPLRKVIILAILLLLVVGGGVYLIQSSGSRLVSNIIQTISGKTEVSRKDGTLGIAELKGYYQDNEQAGRLFVIEGRLVNPWNFSVTSDKVKGSIFDRNGKKLQERIVAAGAILSRSQLKELSAEDIEAAFRSQPGKIAIKAGKSLPFMTVFFNIPNDLSEFEVEVSE